MSEGTENSNCPYARIYRAFLAMPEGGLDLLDIKTGTETANGLCIGLHQAGAMLEGRYRFSAQITRALESFLRTLFVQPITAPLSTISRHDLEQAIALHNEFAPKLSVQNSCDGLIVYGLGTLHAEQSGVHQSNAQLSSTGIGDRYIELAELYFRLFEDCAAGNVPEEPSILSQHIERIEAFWESEQSGLVDPEILDPPYPDEQEIQRTLSELRRWRR